MFFKFFWFLGCCSRVVLGVENTIAFKSSQYIYICIYIYPSGVMAGQVPFVSPAPPAALSTQFKAEAPSRKPETSHPEGALKPET